VTLVVALGVLLLESWRLDRGLARARADQAWALAERLLQRAPASRVAFDLVPEELRARVLADRAVDAADVGWLEPSPSTLDRDLVVEDRLVRASEAEFTTGDPAEALRHYDELLAVPLPSAQRLLVVHAAAWHAVRTADDPRLAVLRDELDRGLEQVAPCDLGRPAIARVLGGALRLPRAGDPPASLAQLATFLPPHVHASLPGELPSAAAHARVVARRVFLREVDAAWRGCAEAVRGQEHGLFPADEHHIVWWFRRPDGGADVALATPREWCRAVTRASAAGALPELPAPYALDAADATGTRFGDVPGVRGILQPGRPAVPTWLGPALTASLLALLLLAFVLALRWQLRAGQREVAAARLQAQFLTTVTHELKTPLAGIHLLGEMLAEGRAAGREQEYYRLLVGEAGRLSMLIDNVLDLGRLERGERGVAVRPENLGKVVAETLTMFEPVARRDGLEVRRRGPASGPTVRVDRAAFVQALVAVLDNARKYGAEGGVLEVDVARAERFAQVTVRDRGPGVPEAERERVFERFVRGERHQNGSTPGVGIGLFLARALMRRQRGDLWLAATADGGPGAVFVFQLPVEDHE
jgi:signal transduction histidine kinase